MVKMDAIDARETLRLFCFSANEDLRRKDSEGRIGSGGGVDWATVACEGGRPPEVNCEGPGVDCDLTGGGPGVECDKRGGGIPLPYCCFEAGVGDGS